MGRQRQESRVDGDPAAGADGAERTCASCGRRMAPRARWSRSPDEVRWCSDACRRRKVTATDLALEEAVLALLAARPARATICPSEAARQVVGDDETAWRPLMEPARRAARRLVARGVVEITQRGSVVDPSTARGPVRVRLR
ncbi:hypothetical protein N866_07675 [Actinotalea ferrariae CF5-4]|uniref:S-adenosylmethionine tRNA ribosyltransferase n=1 Tax=Actinotalea ferrariae CF5-4 TaxID=948458 RepID=A0A021VTW1_9CELL|nr:DUF3253 domain-containing protein [Actinotalea ferrariae]EYR64634.1 hypothetical protein N866_07675 [Actinotalea ferrariae CF5-4]